MEIKTKFQDRLLNIQKLISQKNLDAILLTKRENYMYFSGFNGSSAYLLITQNKNLLFTDSRYIEQANEQAPLFEIIDFKNNFMEALENILISEDIKKIGFESNNIYYDQYIKFSKIKCLEELVPLENAVDKSRSTKEAGEIEIIKSALELAEQAFLDVLKYIKPGTRELEIAAELEYYLKRNGAQGPSFETIVASGKRSSLPHGVASNKKIENGDAIIIDFGAILYDYCSDITRTVFVGEPSKEMYKIYNIVKEAQKAATEGMKQGESCKSVDSIARTIIDQHGFGQYFGHGLGHGVGIEIHEAPSLSQRGEDVLQNNMIVTVEPGIYFPDLGGVRIEDMILVCDDKPIVLNKLSKEMLVI